MFAFNDVTLKVIALLHDLIEDTPITIDELRSKRFSEDILEAIAALTKRNDESYEQFILRISQNSLAKQVKIADLKDNMNLARLNKITQVDLERLQKYHNSLIFFRKNKASIKTGFILVS